MIIFYKLEYAEIKLYLYCRKTLIDVMHRKFQKGFCKLARNPHKRDGPSYVWHEYELLLHSNEYEHGYDDVVGVRKYFMAGFLLLNLLFFYAFY